MLIEIEDVEYIVSKLDLTDVENLVTGLFLNQIAVIFQYDA